MTALPTYIQDFISPAGFRRERDIGIIKQQTDGGTLQQRRRFSGVRITERLEAVISAADYDKFIIWLDSIRWIGRFDYTPPGHTSPVNAVIVDGKVEDRLLDGTLAWRKVRLQVSYDV